VNQKTRPILALNLSNHHEYDPFGINPCLSWLRIENKGLTDQPIIANVFSLAYSCSVSVDLVMSKLKRLTIYVLFSVMCMHTAGVFASLHAYSHHSDQQSNHASHQSQCDHQHNNETPSEPQNPEHHDCPTCLTLAGSQLIATIEPGFSGFLRQSSLESYQIDSQCTPRRQQTRDRSPRAPPMC
jgi:hypothetical protein